jgi:hypothetical protein
MVFLKNEQGCSLTEPVEEGDRGELPAPDWVCGPPFDDPQLRRVGRPDPGPIYWNPLTGTYQTDEELWAWSGNWDL